MFVRYRKIPCDGFEPRGVAAKIERAERCRRASPRPERAATGPASARCGAVRTAGSAITRKRARPGAGLCRWSADEPRLQLPHRLLVAVLRGEEVTVNVKGHLDR